MNKPWLVISLFLWSGLVFASANSVQKPDIRIVRGYEGVAKFLEEAPHTDEAEHAKLYANYVGDAYREDCYVAGTEESSAAAKLDSPPDYTEHLLTAIEKMKRADVDRMTLEVLANVHKHLPFESLTVCIFPYIGTEDGVNFVKTRMGGVMGFSEHHGILWIEPAPTEGWVDKYPRLVAHEFHHALTAFTPGETQDEFTLLKMMLVEGQADAFANMIYPGPVNPWSDALNAEQEKQAWNKIKPNLSTTDYHEIEKHIFGSKEEGIPHWAGYTIGYRVVQSYLEKHPQEKPVSWSYMDKQQMLERSGYAPGD